MRALAALAALAALGACATTASAPMAALAPQDAFWAALSSHCGKAYAGQLVSNEAVDADMRGMAMAMHVRECSGTRIAVPFHIQRADGTWDRSRTWLITRTETGLRLKHDHRHEDGSEDSLTKYGGDTAAGAVGMGTARDQSFPVDAESIALFQREGRTVSLTNVWQVSVDPAGTPDAKYVYALTRPAPNARLFQVEFDLTRPIAAPPAPWGWN